MQTGRLTVREVPCRSVLHEMDGPNEYTANLYRGCSHGCVYCYAPSLIHDERRWGGFVDVKVNGPEVLSRELRKVRKGVVFLSSASDPYQPAEAKYKLTRRALVALLNAGFPVAILTRSPLVLRDIDVLRKLSWVRVGVSISSVPGRLYEPGVAPVSRRVETLRRLSDAGIKTWVSLAPLVPGMMGLEVPGLLRELRSAGVSAVAAGILRFRGYERSRELFEEVSGLDSDDVVGGGAQTMEWVRRLVRETGFEPLERFFEWQPPVVETGVQASLLA